jgi:hypothetical protein
MRRLLMAGMTVFGCAAYANAQQQGGQYLSQGYFN